MSVITRIGTAAILTVAAASGAAAQSRPAAIQDRQFMFSVSTLPEDVRRVSVNVDTGFGERAFDVTDSDRPEQRFGVQAFLGHGLTFVGRVGVSEDQRELASSQQGELLYSVLQSPDAQGSVAIGMGVRHESAGANVLLGRVAAGRGLREWRLDGNALLEKPVLNRTRRSRSDYDRRRVAASAAGPLCRRRDDWRRPRRLLGDRGSGRRRARINRAVVPNRAADEAVVRQRCRRADHPCDAQRALERRHPRSAGIEQRGGLRGQGVARLRLLGILEEAPLGRGT